MALNFKETKQPKKDYGRVEDGTYMARLVQMIELGDHEEQKFQSEETVVRSKLWLTFELPTETFEVTTEEDGVVVKPRWISKEITISGHEKSTLVQWVKALDPTGEVSKGGRDAVKLLGQPCMVTVGTTSGGNAKITGVAPMMKGMDVPELANEANAFDYDAPDKAVFDKLPAFLQEKIETALNRPGSAVDIMLSGASDADVSDLLDESA